MASERFWDAIPTLLFITDGGSEGQVSVLSTRNIKVKQKVLVKATSLNSLNLEVKRVLNSTDIILGPVGGKMRGVGSFTDLTTFTTSLSASITIDEQDRPAIFMNEWSRAVYEEEPTMAIRTTSVDELGNKFGIYNPFPSSVFFKRNGQIQEVLEDTVTPSNNRPLPVKMTGFDGDVVINADNLNLETQTQGVYNSETNPEPDNVGLIVHERSVITDKTKQLERPTAIRGDEDTDNVSLDIALHDHKGNKYSTVNPLPVSTAYEKFFSLVSASNWLVLANYDQVIPNFVGNDLILDYYEDGVLIGQAIVTNYVSQTEWTLDLKAYLNDDDGSQLLDDDDQPLIME